ncbi:MAG: hypothetical protein PWQ57_918 [Desulfovibrionales bacterium]|nr:hypothetical protein [Desulfovibrionales bacterium]
MSEVIYGQDIALDDDWQPKVAADGSLILTDGVDTGLQDIRLRLFTPLGELFYDVGFGSLVHYWIKEESTSATRAAFCQEVRRRVQADPRVVIGSASCKILSWDETGITARVTFTFIDETHPYNLIVTVGGDSRVDVIVDDIDARDV